MLRPPLHIQSLTVSRKNPTRLAIILSLIVCYSLLLSSLVLANPTTMKGKVYDEQRSDAVGLAEGNSLLGSARQVLASLIAIFQGGGQPTVPGPNLPNLDAARATQPVEPVAPAPIVSAQACTDCTPCPTCGPGTANHTPVVSAAGPYSGTAGSTMSVNGLGSFDVDPGDGISDYSWTFGDNTPAVQGPMPSHTYQSAGIYNVSLTVTDRHNSSSNTTTTAMISAPPATVPPSGSVQGNGAQFIFQSAATTMTAGLRYNVSVTMRNTGTTTWSAAHLYRLGSQNPQDNGNWGKNRIYLPKDTPPNDEVTFNFPASAPFGTPLTTTAVNFQWQM